ncbi:MAG: hypothetical protein H7338_02055 [Candidatus Sericytochromatia bacterium]|nr:hypothetical protein [Candidatus Sericytochromatia bacterium]
MLAKPVVKGEGQHPLYRELTEAMLKADDLGDSSFATKLARYGITQEQLSDVLWNFEQFLVDRQG